MHQRTGILYGVGVGPGDAELMTRKAVRRIREADVICLPQTDRARCRAYLTASAAVPELAGKPCLCLDFPMTRDRARLAAAHGNAYAQIRARLLNGEDAAFLTVGDPAVYSTFARVAERARADGFTVETVSGVTSFQASAAALGVPLCDGDEPLHVGSGQEDADALLALPGTRVLLKCGRNLGQIKARLRELARERPLRVYAVTDCALPSQLVFEGIEAIPEDAGYMTTVIVRD